MISVLYASYTGQQFAAVAAQGEFRCRLNKLPLKQGAIPSRRARRGGGGRKRIGRRGWWAAGSYRE